MDAALAEAIGPMAPGLSRTRVKSLILDGRVSTAGRTIVDPSQRVKPGDAFDVDLPEAKPAIPVGQAMALDILFEDDHLLVLDKPPGLVVHPAPGNPDGTLVNALIAHCGDGLTGIGGVRRPGIVHRLDKDTSGIMVVAKDDATHQALTTAFAARRIERAYQALVYGVPAPPEGLIEGAIGRDPKDRKRMAVVTKGGREAQTRYRLLRAFGTGAAEIECRLLTGRTHQIRVHLAAKGHPLLGDPVYGRATAARKAALSTFGRAALANFNRQALHARSLGFNHPITGDWLVFSRAPPDDYVTLVTALAKSD